MQGKFNMSAKAGAALRTAMAMAIAASCVAAPGFAYAKPLDSTAERDESQAKRKSEAQITLAETKVAKSLQNASARAELAQAYLAAGRFLSAGQTFEDAVTLGDRSPATALGMVLAHIGVGRNSEATALLAQWRDSIPAGDFALALALAGQPQQAVALLSEVIRHGESTPKIRQNLAYAYALAGHLREARIIASQDVPADQIDARVSEWALQASVGSQQSRVAALLGAPLMSDPGQPVQLALSRPDEAVALALHEPSMTNEELAPLGGDPEMESVAPPFALAQLTTREDADLPEPVDAVTSAPVVDIVHAGLPQSDAEPRFVANPVVQSVAVVAARRSPPAKVLPARSTESTKPDVSGTGGDHAVQLGSFASEEGARRAWSVFVRRDPSLRERTMRITEAVVKGRRYWRVAAAGYESGEAHAKCSAVRRQGKGCLAYVEARSLPGAVAPQTAAERLASR